jgi:hypothetical protein
MSYRFLIFAAALGIAFVWIGNCLNSGGGRLLAMDAEDAEYYYEQANTAYEQNLANLKFQFDSNNYDEIHDPPTDLSHTPNTQEREELGGGGVNHPTGFDNPNEVDGEDDEALKQDAITASANALAYAVVVEDLVENVGGAPYEERKHSKDGDVNSQTNPGAEAEKNNQGE